MFALVATGLCPVLSFFNPLFVLQLFILFFVCECSVALVFVFVLLLLRCSDLDVSIIIRVFLSRSLSIDYYSNFLFRLNDFSLFTRGNVRSSVFPDSCQSDMVGGHFCFPFFLSCVKCKIGCQKLASLGALNSIKTLASFHFVDVVVVVIYFFRHHVDHFKCSTLIGKFIECLPRFFYLICLCFNDMKKIRGFNLILDTAMHCGCSMQFLGVSQKMKCMSTV